MRAEAARRLAESQIRRRHPEVDDPDVFDDLVDELLDDWRREDAQDRSEGWYQSGAFEPECIENCDDAGTGEGRFHGRF